MLRHVDLCSGIGGFALGFEWADLATPVLFCDIESWSRQILAKHWPHVPISDDVRKLASDPDRLVPDCDILTAGYPCQPFSFAGKRKGTADDRHIWPEIFAIVQAKRPDWCVFENVSGHINMGLDEVLSDLEGENYTVQAFVVPACALNAPHRRDRVWIVAHTNRNGQPDGTQHEQRLEPFEANDPDANSQRSHREKQHKHRNSEPPDRKKRDLGSVREILAGRGNTENRETFDVAHADSITDAQHRSNHTIESESGSGNSDKSGSRTNAWRLSDTGKNENVANANSNRRERQRPKRNDEGSPGLRGGKTGRNENFWISEPAVGRVAHGIPRRVDRLRGLGNAIVPQIAMQIGMTIKHVEEICTP